MTSCTEKIKAAEQILQDLTFCEKSLDIPGNFRAKQRRTKHDDSRLVFPNPRKKQTDTYKTHYSHQFRSKPNARPSSARPCSPTRRNNPHPSKNFLNWRIPTRVFDYGKVKLANISFLKSNIEDSYQRFYEDYSGKQDTQHHVDPRQLIGIAKSYAAAIQKQKKESDMLPGLLNMRKKERVTLGLCSPPTSPIGIKLPTVMRNSWSPEQSSFAMPRSQTKKKGRKQPKTSSPPTFYKQEFRPSFNSWYDGKIASKECPPVGNEDVEESPVEEAIAALKSEALAAIENWLLNASDEERQIAMKFIEAIILASVETSNISVEPNKSIETSKILAETQKGAIPQQFVAPYPGNQNPVKNAQHHNHNMRKACEVCQKQELEAALQQLQTIASLPMEVPAITELLNPQHPAVISERDALAASGDRKLNRPRNDRSRHERPAFIANKGSLFMNSKRPSGRHFTIHPEWH